MLSYGDDTQQVDRFHGEILKSAAVGKILKKRNCSLFSYHVEPDNPLFGSHFDDVDTDLPVCKRREICICLDRNYGKVFKLILRDGESYINESKRPSRSCSCGT